jgi:eukaryotic-like serine/threonine-protein kinase
MNTRLVNHPVPPREADPGVSLELQEIIYRALARDPKRRYANARDFSWDLQHQEQLGIVDRPELRDWNLQSSTQTRASLLYGALAMIPVFLFMLLLYVAGRG